MLVLLFDTYRGITQNGLVDNNNNRIAELFDPAQPIESFFRTIQNTVDCADAGHAPFGVNQIMAQNYARLLNNGVLLDGCKKWN
jgi:hypothetical protein